MLAPDYARRPPTGHQSRSRNQTGSDWRQCLLDIARLPDASNRMDRTQRVLHGLFRWHRTIHSGGHTAPHGINPELRFDVSIALSNAISRATGTSGCSFHGRIISVSHCHFLAYVENPVISGVPVDSIPCVWVCGLRCRNRFLVRKELSPSPGVESYVSDRNVLSNVLGADSSYPKLPRHLSLAYLGE